MGPVGSVSVILSVRNEERYLGDQLRSLAAQEWERDWELVVVDHGSHDDTLEVVEANRHLFDNLRVIELAAKANVGYARNEGIEASRGDILVLCDGDDVVGEGWLRALVGAFDSGAGLACGRLDTSLLNSDFWRRGRDAIQSEGPQQIPGHPPHAAGANLAFTRSVYEEVGGFDEELANLTDVDFCWRAARAGAEMAWVPEAVVHYRLRDSVGAVFGQARSYARCRAELERRHGPDEAWMLTRPWYRELGSLAVMGVEATRHLVAGRGARAIWVSGRWLGRVEGRIDARSR
jgi:glycosyltransferase involved in cell wall biosynthesis